MIRLTVGSPATTPWLTQHCPKQDNRHRTTGDGKLIAETTADGKSKVFIPYSRAELAFADELVAGLEYGL
jgi:hypothetical protein